MKISPARASAFDILLKIAEEKAYSSVLLPACEEHLSRADAGLCHELVLGVLRRQMYLDRVIDVLAKGKKLDIAVRICLRIGLYQMAVLTRIPAHSAVNESVNLTVRAKKTSAKGLVNAVLRSYLRSHPVIDPVDNIDRIVVSTSHPRWLIEKWAGDIGLESAERLAGSNNKVANTAFRVLSSGRDVDELISRSIPSRYLRDCWIAPSGDSDIISLSARGAIYLQDEASQIVGNAVGIAESGKFLDVCAAPGGKTGLIARKHDSGRRLIVAGDLRQKRAEFLRDNCEVQSPGSVSVVRYDAARSLPFADGSFDSVLVDAPCSGTGTIRHNPEIRYFLQKDDLSELQAKQLSILENASKLLAPRGDLIYSTCSVEPEENEQVVSKFLSAHPEIEQVVPRVSPELITDTGGARTWPYRDEMDGFFIAAFHKQN